MRDYINPLICLVIRVASATTGQGVSVSISFFRIFESFSVVAQSLELCPWSQVRLPYKGTKGYGKVLLDFSRFSENRVAQSLELCPIPRNRSCSEAGIEPHWCACVNWKNVTDSTMMQRTADAFVDYINQLTEPQRSLCVPRTLKEIKWVMVQAPNKGVLSFVAANDKDGYTGKFGKAIKIPKQIYQVQVVVGPGNGVYEASMTYLANEDKFIMDTKDISRTNVYGNEPHCISATHPHLNMYCYCKKLETMKSELLEQFKSSITAYKLDYENYEKNEYGTPQKPKSVIGKKLVLPASKLQPIPPDLLLKVGKLAAFSKPNIVLPQLKYNKSINKTLHTLPCIVSDHTIVVDSENGSILRMVTGQKFIYEGGEISLVMPDDEQGDASGETQDHADSQGGAFIKVESGEMFRVKSVSSARPDTPLQIVAPYNDQFKCTEKEVVSEADAMMRHLKTVHDARLYLCRFCGAVMRKRNEYTSHIAEHVSEGKSPAEGGARGAHRCGTCGKCFSSRSLLQEHHNVHSGARPYSCSVCHKAFASKDYMGQCRKNNLQYIFVLIEYFYNNYRDLYFYNNYSKTY
ncbi:hypothetical protein SFRURICE_015266 [Spodoptera frugiperda]|nr:hypothetical protein SFRURICE_015266 [Spodoptera frugiperda]